MSSKQTQKRRDFDIKKNARNKQCEMNISKNAGFAINKTKFEKRQQSMSH